MPIDALSVLCAQLMRNLLAIAKFFCIWVWYLRTSILMAFKQHFQGVCNLISSLMKDSTPAMTLGVGENRIRIITGESPALSVHISISWAVAAPTNVLLNNFYRATHMHSTDYAITRCPSVSLSIHHTPVFCSNSVHLSVCLSVRDIPVSDENDLTYRHRFFTIW